MYARDLDAEGLLSPYFSFLFTIITVDCQILCRRLMSLARFFHIHTFESFGWGGGGFLSHGAANMVCGSFGFERCIQ